MHAVRQGRAIKLMTQQSSVDFGSRTSRRAKNKTERLDDFQSFREKGKKREWLIEWMSKTTSVEVDKYGIWRAVTDVEPPL